MKGKVGENLSNSSDNNGDKAVIVRVKRKANQSPLEAFWLEINERPVKRPLIDFEKLSISASSTSEELKTKRVLVQHVETVNSSESSIQFLQSFVQPPSDGDSKFKSSSKDRRRTLQKDDKHEQLLSKAKQEQEDLAKSARFEQIWKRRMGKEVVHDEALDEVCRVYDVRRVDQATSRIVKQEEISIEDKEIFNTFLPLLRECIPDAAAEIESDLCSHAPEQDSGDEYVYDLYAVNKKIDEADTSYPFPLVQVDDDDQYFNALDDSDYESDDSNAENHPLNDYPEEESLEEEEERSSESGSESEEKSEAESEDDMWNKNEDSDVYDQIEDPFYDEDMYESHNNTYSDDGDDNEDWRWAYR